MVRDLRRHLRMKMNAFRESCIEQVQRNSEGRPHALSMQVSDAGQQFALRRYVGVSREIRHP